MYDHRVQEIYNREPEHLANPGWSNEDYLWRKCNVGQGQDLHSSGFCCRSRINHGKQRGKIIMGSQKNRKSNIRFFQGMLGPVVELELVNPLDKVLDFFLLEKRFWMVLIVHFFIEYKVPEIFFKFFFLNW